MLQLEDKLKVMPKPQLRGLPSYHCAKPTATIFNDKRTISSAKLCYQGSHRLEKYLNIQDCLKKSLRINFALKILKKHSKALKSP